MNIEYQHNVAQPPTLTHGELCRIACDFLQREGFKVAFDDRFRTKTQYGELPDAIGFRKWTSCLIEVKCSRADLLADRKKRFRITPEKGTARVKVVVASVNSCSQCFPLRIQPYFIMSTPVSCLT